MVVGVPLGDDGFGFGFGVGFGFGLTQRWTLTRTIRPCRRTIRPWRRMGTQTVRRAYPALHRNG